MSTQTKWTPGPWRVWRDMDPKEPRQIIGMETDFICQIDETNTNKDANARLISLAPEMAEALRGIDKLSCNCPLMSREVQSLFACHPSMEEYRVELAKVILAMREAARAILAKLEGERVPGVREDFRTGQFVPTINGKDISPTSFDEHRALEIAQQSAAKLERGDK